MKILIDKNNFKNILIPMNHKFYEMTNDMLLEVILFSLRM